MKVINFTTAKLGGVTKSVPLIYDSSLLKDVMKGRGISEVANSVFRQIESHTDSETAIVLDLPLLLTVEVESLLAKNGVVKEVFYFIANRLMNSPAFDLHRKRLEQSIEQDNSLKLASTI